MDQDDVPLTELERLLVAAAEDPAERPAFALALLESDVLVSGWLDQPALGGVAQAGTSMRVVSMSDSDGPITPFFTSEAALQRALTANPDADRRFLRLKCRDLFSMVNGQRLVLNPHSPSGKVYTPSEVEALLAGKEPGVVEEVLAAERRVLVGAAANIPPRLPEVLTRYFTQRPTVATAHLGWIAHLDGHQGFLLVVIAGDRAAAMSGFGTLQINELTEGHDVDVMVEPPGTDGHLLRDVAPFYTRQPQPDTPDSRRRFFSRKR